MFLLHLWSNECSLGEQKRLHSQALKKRYWPQNPCYHNLGHIYFLAINIAAVCVCVFVYNAYKDDGGRLTIERLNCFGSLQ